MFFSVISIIWRGIRIVASGIGFLCLQFRFLNLTTNFYASKCLRGRKIFIDKSGGYIMVTDYLNFYFAQLEAVIVDNASSAEFQLILTQDMMDLAVNVCRLSDRDGNVKTLRIYEGRWPKPLAMALANLIRKSDQRPVRNKKLENSEAR